MRQRSADVVIVGAGVAGALMAARIARAGLKVLVLEAGPRVERGAAIEQYRRAAIKVPECPYPNEPYAAHPRSDAIDEYYLQQGPEKFGSTYLRQVGGTTWHWLGTVLRFVPDDFRLRSRFGVGVDWPITYDDLEPWYGDAERELGVSGDSAVALNAPRSRPYPQGPIPLSYLDTRFKAALSGQGFRVEATPQARNSTFHAGRPACCGSSSCIPICPIQAKYDATVHIEQAEKAGAEVLDRAVAAAIDVDVSGRVTAVVIRRPDRTEERVAGKMFVIAAHGIETPKLLLQSRTGTRPAGVANSSDQVGRNLMDHPTQLSWAQAGEPVWPFRGPLSTSGIEAPRAGDWRATRPAFRIQIDNQGWSWPLGTPGHTVRALLSQGLRGAALDRALVDRTSREVSLAHLTEQLPDPDNRIVPDFDARDAIGIPRPRISFRFDDYTRRGLAEARAIHARIFAALKCTEVAHADDVKAAGHIIGTCRMGANPRDSVVDVNLRAHDHPNLYIVGSTVFPTSAASNPTLTIAALALRAARHLALSV